MKTATYCLALFMGLGAGAALASDLIIYPANGQSKDQQEQDEYQCYNWAKDRTGFDPMQQPRATSAPPPDSSQSTGSGLVGGALLGAAVGGIADGGDGAAKGAAIGGLFGGMRARNSQRTAQAQQDQWAQNQAAQYQSRRNEYNRAFAACMDSRGYTVR